MSKFKSIINNMDNYGIFSIHTALNSYSRQEIISVEDDCILVKKSGKKYYVNINQIIHIRAINDLYEDYE